MSEGKYPKKCFPGNCCIMMKKVGYPFKWHDLREGKEMEKDSRMRMLFFGMFAFLILLTGCTSKPELVPSKYDEAGLNQLAGVVMTTTQTSYVSGTQKIQLKIRNDTDSEYFYGVAFAVEQKVEGKWYEVPFKEEPVFIQLAVVLAPHSENLETVDLGILAGELKPGLYRIVKEMEGEAVTAEFKIVQPSGGGY